LINIVTNAIKFSPGGSVKLTMHREGRKSLKFVVADSGIGMDAAGIALALRPFGQVDSGLNRKYEGTGLGVPIAKSLVELQGGTFHIESEPGTGTRVTVTLPFETCVLAENEPAAAAR
jgi:signal transduction histidine kinase